MKGRKPTMFAGMITMLLGMIFHLQGQTIVGPESSFMYANPQWKEYGIQIILLGSSIVGIGAILSMIKKDNQPQ